MEFASKELKDNPIIVEIAVSQNGLALKYASEKLKNYAYIVDIAIKNNPNASQYKMI